MGPIDPRAVLAALESRAGRDLYLHLETNAGAYAGLRNTKVVPVGAYIRNGRIRFERGALTGSGPYRVGLKMDDGWVYAEGLTDWEEDDQGRLLLAGHDADGALGVALQLSDEAFPL
jgi:hypothetical protein